MRRTWWHVAFRSPADDETRHVFVHGGRAFKAVLRASVAVGRGWRLELGPIRIASSGRLHLVERRYPSRARHERQEARRQLKEARSLTLLGRTS
jgi:hypothetical protein